MSVTIEYPCCLNIAVDIDERHALTVAAFGVRCRIDPFFKNVVCRQQWASVWRSLIALQRCSEAVQDKGDKGKTYANGILLWQGLGETMKLEGQVTERGCDWFKCPLYGVSLNGLSAIELLRCSACIEVRYVREGLDSTDIRI